ncbi:MAG TPA: hypothetical protein VK623_05675 [Flavobacterium sp.]|nr:hypothetical protein [Flavobacterium sp.]
MFNQYSYKKKFTALLVVFFMLCIASYKRSFHTLALVIAENRDLSKTTADMKMKSKNVKNLSDEIANLDKAIGKDGVAKEIVQQGIVAFVSENHPGVSINDLQPIHIFSDSNYNIITNQLDITGRANQLVDISYDFEKRFGLSKITSLNFYTTKKNNKTESLHLKIIFQNYESNK